MKLKRKTRKGHALENDRRVLLDEELPLPHQLLPDLLRLLIPQQARIVKDVIPNLRRNPPHGTLLARLFDRQRDLASDPVALLRRDGRRRDDALERVNEEEDEDLAVAGFGRIDEGERRDLVLVDVRKSYAAVVGGREGIVGLDAGSIAKRRRQRRRLVEGKGGKGRRSALFDAEYSANPAVVVLLVRYFEICTDWECQKDRTSIGKDG